MIFIIRCPSAVGLDFSAGPAGRLVDRPSQTRPGESLFYDLKAISAPTLILHGFDDRVCLFSSPSPSGTASPMQARALEECGHFLSTTSKSALIGSLCNSSRNKILNKSTKPGTLQVPSAERSLTRLERIWNFTQGTAIGYRYCFRPRHFRSPSQFSYMIDKLGGIF